MDGNLIQELAISTVLVSVTVVIHLIGIDVLQSLTRWHLDRFTTWIHLDRMIVPLGIVLGLFVVHGLEIWLYALFYWRMDLLPTLEQALYFSTSAYSTVGETGAILPKAWRIVGVLEAINGMLLIGWTTAFLFQILDHLMRADASAHLPPRGAIAKPSPRARGSRKGAPSGTNSNDTELMQ
ncbi:MAG TPA: ion channel [Phenylobacterium sp.]|nr:ion channel [Phenylobacterium sp.]